MDTVYIRLSRQNGVHVALIIALVAFGGSYCCGPWPGTAYFRGKCFKLVDRSVIWNDTKSECDNEFSGARLGIIESNLTIRYMESLFITFQKTNPVNSGPMVWTQDIDSSSMPHEQSGTCTALNMTSGVMEMIPCRQQHIFVCVLEVGNPCKMSDTDGDIVGSSCYFEGSNKSSWETAQLDCQSKGMHLVEFDDAVERGVFIGVIHLLKLQSPVLLGAQRNVSMLDSFQWITSEEAVEQDVYGPHHQLENVSCLAIWINETDGYFTSVACDEGMYSYICEDVAPVNNFFIVLPEALQMDNSTNEAFLSMATGNDVIFVLVEVYNSGIMTNTSSFLVFGKLTYKYEISSLTKFLLTNFGIYGNSIYVFSFGMLELSLVYTTSSDSGTVLTSADVTIYPDLFLDTYYVIMTSRMSDNTTMRSFLAVVATQEKTTTDIYFASRYFNVKIIRDGIEIYNIQTLKVGLKKFESLFVESESDLTGVAVRADKPVAVYSGNMKAQLDEDCCPNYAMAMTFPFDHVTSFYLFVMPSELYYHLGMMRMTATQDLTVVEVYDETNSELYRSFSMRSAGATRDFPIPRAKLMSFHSNVPCLLAFLGPVGEADPEPTSIASQEPCFMPVPPLHLYKKSFYFSPRVLLPSWTHTWLAVIGMNLNTTHPSVRINLQSIDEFVTTQELELTQHGSNTYRSVIINIADRDQELWFDTVDNTSFIVMLYWRTVNHSFCRIVGIDVTPTGDWNSTLDYFLEDNYETSTRKHRSKISKEKFVSSQGNWYSITPNINSTQIQQNITNSIVNVTGLTIPTTTVPTNETTDVYNSSNPNIHNDNDTNDNLSVSCQLNSKATYNLTDSEIQNLVKEIQKKLYVNPRSLSAFTRKYESAKDSRPSSTTFGYFGIAIFTGMILSLLLADIITFSLFVFKWAKIFKERYYG